MMLRMDTIRLIFERFAHDLPGLFEQLQILFDEEERKM